MTERVTQVFLMVSDVERSRAFYEEGLGLETVETGDRSATFETGGCQIVVEEDFDAETLAGFGLEPPGDRRGDGAIVVLEVDDVEAKHGRVDEYGAEVLTPPRVVDWGRKLFLVRDPDGYVLEVSRPT